MSIIGERSDILSDLVAAGIPATLDPAQFVTMVAGPAGCAALLLPPARVEAGYGLESIRFDQPVILASPGPAHDGLGRLLLKLNAAINVLLPNEPTDWDPWDVDDETTLPAYRIVSPRTTTP